MRQGTSLIVVILLALAAAACGGDNGSAPASPSPVPTAAASVTATLVATPVPAPQQPPGTRTGVAEVDAAIDALLARNDGAVEALTLFQPFPCVAVQRGPGDTPACPPGVADGTIVEAMSDEFCEGALIPRALFPGFTRNALPPGAGLYAVYSVPAPNHAPPTAGARTYSVVFAVPGAGSSPEYALVAEISDELITRFRRPCALVGPRAFWEASLRLPGFDALLAPLDE